MAALKYWLWLADAAVSPRAKAALLRRYGDAQRAFFAPSGEIKATDGVGAQEAELLEARSLAESERIIAACDELGIDIITLEDRAYPVRLKNIFAPPPVLYVKGKLPPMDDFAAIAVVGTRRASAYGLKMARELAFEIIQCGGLVVSGLTDGIDAAAAEGALAALGKCVGVLGIAIDGDKTELSRKVCAAGGAVVSEYAPGIKPKRSYFRDRNRVTAGLAVGAVAVEAPEKSGTRLFIDEAAEQGKEIFAVPANADAYNSAGTITMLKDGAKLVTNGWDVMSEFEWRFPDSVRRPELAEIKAMPRPANTQAEGKTARTRRKNSKKVIDKENNKGYIDLKAQLDDLNDTQLKIIGAIDPGGTHIDDIIERTGFNAATVLAQLTFLEIKGFVGRLPGRRFLLNTARK